MLLISYLGKYTFPVKHKDIKIKLFSVIARTNEAKTLVKHISCNYKRQFNITKCNSTIE